MKKITLFALGLLIAVGVWADVPCDAPTSVKASNVTETSAKITWTPVAGQTKWLLEYRKAEQQGSSPVAHITTTSYTLTNLQPATEYIVYVSAYCGHDMAVSDEFLATSFTTQAASDPCNMPTNITASNITTNSATIAWTKGGSEAEWELRYYQVGNSAAGMRTAYPTTNSYTIKGLNQGAEYGVAVRAKCGTNDYSEWTGYYKFTVATESTPEPELELYGYRSGTSMIIAYDDKRAERNGLYPRTLNDDGWLSFAKSYSIRTIEFAESVKNARPTILDYWFRGFGAVTSIVHLDYLNTSDVTSMSYMFDGCNSLTSIDLSSFNTSKVQYMSGMFNKCTALTSLDLSSFDTKNVIGMANMFGECKALASLDISSFKTSRVQSFEGMFSTCSTLKSIDVNHFNLSAAYEVSWMFYNCVELTHIYCDNDWREYTSITSSHNMFDNCVKLVGGQGSAVQYGEWNITYAHPDGGTTDPGYFTSTAQGIDEVQSDNLQATKVIRDGKLFIEINGRTYDVTGAEVR